MSMKYTEDLLIRACKYYKENKSTIRKTCTKFNISRSYLGFILKYKLKSIDYELYLDCEIIRNCNSLNACKRGGEAIRKMYENKNYKKKGDALN